MAYSQAHFGPGSGDIFLDDVMCTGTEITLLACDQNPIGKHNCRHHEDAGVSCVGNATTNQLMYSVGKDYDQVFIIMFFLLRFSCELQKW